MTTKTQIAMTGRRPVSIDKEDWPLVSKAEWHNGQYDFQANEIRRVVVREHADGRRLVYGLHDSGPGGTNIGFRSKHAGFLVEANCNSVDEQSTVHAIRKVADIIGDERLGEECISGLPSEDI